MLGGVIVGSLVVLVVDMQNSYLVQDVRDAYGWPPLWRRDEVVSECRSLITEARSQGVPVIYSRQVSPPVMTPRSARHRDSRADRLPVLSDEEKSWRSQIMDAVAPVPSELVLDKTRHSFFAYTELDPVLRGLGADRLIVCGLQTNVCVEATVRAALERNFEVAVPEDAVTTDGPDLHIGSLDSMRVMYVEVAPWRDLLAAGAAWDRAYSTPHYGRNPQYWVDSLYARD
ncbi:cysteine hydrolase family protein [Nocardia carnea]|uniref:Cysteine hydrolase family protein n=1 Tax=Nocardia carnea TaxID=37328 RepID=A0ABW7TW70_9NOCA|nr:isochorismatase family cysteine hydrolase [Nocardia carnea]